MSVPYIVWAFQQRDLTPPQRVVLISLCDRANGERVCFPSFSQIMRDCEISLRAVKAAVRYLADVRGLIVKVTDPSERGKILSRARARDNTRSNIYRIMRPADAPDGAPRAPSRRDDSPIDSAPHAPSPAPDGAKIAPLMVHDVHSDGAPRAPETSKETRKEPKRAKKGFDSFPIKQASEVVEDRPPSPAEVVAGRIEAHGDVAAMPAAARCAISTIKHAMLAPVPRPPKLSWSEQVAALADRRSRPVPQEPIRTVDEQLAELQRMIAAEVATRQPQLRVVDG